jgi:hypothetical protein
MSAVYTTAGAVVGVIQGLSRTTETSIRQSTSYCANYCAKEAYRVAGLFAGIVAGCTLNIVTPLTSVWHKVENIQASPIKYRIKDLESLMQDRWVKNRQAVQLRTLNEVDDVKNGVVVSQ